MMETYVGKVLTNKKLRTFFTSCKTITEEKKTFREKRSTVRSVYREQLELENFQRNKKPAVLLKVDLEKDFDSAWIDGLLYKLQNIGLTRHLLSTIQVFLNHRLLFINIGNYQPNKFPIYVVLPASKALYSRQHYAFCSWMSSSMHTPFDSSLRMTQLWF